MNYLAWIKFEKKTQIKGLIKLINVGVGNSLVFVLLNTFCLYIIHILMLFTFYTIRYNFKAQVMPIQNLYSIFAKTNYFIITKKLKLLK